MEVSTLRLESGRGKLVLKQEGGAVVVNIRNDDGQLMTKKLLKLLKDHGNDLLVPAQLIIDILEEYQVKSKKLRSVTKENRLLKDELSNLADEIDAIQQALVNEQCAYDQLNDEFGSAKAELDEWRSNEAP